MNFTRDLIAIIIVLGAVASFFFNVNEIGSELIRFFSGAVIGFYFGVKQIPVVSLFKKKVKEEKK
jgi:uncharacterized membrane protein